MDERTLRAWWFDRQGLGALAGALPADVLSRSGWARSVGGASPYLALFARAGTARADADAAVAALAIHELPAARGCTYVVPACDYALALRAGQGFSSATELAVAKQHLGVTDREIARLCERIETLLAVAPLDPQAMKAPLGSAVRSLGDEGKRRGTTTTLPLALGLLQSQGRIRRRPQNGRLDQQRYAYALWRPGPLDGVVWSDEELHLELARLFFRVAGPATIDQLGRWSGLTKRDARRAAATLRVVPLAADDERLLLPEERAALAEFRRPREARFALTGSLDNLLHLRGGSRELIDARHNEVKVHGNRGLAPLAALGESWQHHALLDRGEWIGVWEYDVARSTIVWGLFGGGGAAAGLKREIARTEQFVRDQLGDARSFSLDAPTGREARIATVEGLGGRAKDSPRRA